MAVNEVQGSRILKARRTQWMPRRFPCASGISRFTRNGRGGILPGGGDARSAASRLLCLAQPCRAAEVKVYEVSEKKKENPIGAARKAR